MILTILIALLWIPVADAHQTTLGRSCRAIVRDFHEAWGNQMDWIWSFPVDRQRHVRACLIKRYGREPFQ